MEKNSSSLYGTLYIVSTPIGNLEDITYRAVKILKSVDAILAEDTRHSGLLCKALGIEKPFISMHNHNESQRSTVVIQRLMNGQSLALISDAGTPLIADPGFILVKQAREAGIAVVPIPGCCALITALSASGIPCERFTFEGFLPAKSLLRKNKLREFTTSEITVVVYESTHRILACFKDIIDILGPNYELTMAKELTKTFENFITDKTSNILQWLEIEPQRKKGEFVLLFPPQPKKENNEDETKLLRILLDELPLKQAVKILNLITDSPKNKLYEKALALQSNA